MRLHIENGRITSISVGTTAGSDDDVAGVVVPGIANAHSHAFQRALAGHCEFRGSSTQDNFWSWRVQMYRLANAIDARELTVIARQLYCEMLAAGYTSVAEFHYQHRGRNDSTTKKMSEAILQAAADSGIRLTYVPILYERAGFDQSKPTNEQRRFTMNFEEYVEHYEEAISMATSTVTVGVGAHSLRAVTHTSLEKLAELSDRKRCPMHIHIAEQTVEVAQCLERCSARPVEWLFKSLSPNERWCLVHATHVTEQELNTMSESDVVVCLCPSTEGNLGDGIFPLRAWRELGGRIAIGSDSHVTINPFEELRWLEYGQRLTRRLRNVSAVQRSHTGQELFEQVIEGGATACGIGIGDLRAGGCADLIDLVGDSPMLTGHDDDSILDALAFCGTNLPIKRVMVAGEWKVHDGKHIAAPQVEQEFMEITRKLWSTS